MEKTMNTRLCQFRYETSSWKRVLEFIKQENIVAKNHLAEVISFSPAEQYFLNDVEYLLNNIVKIETAVSLIHKDVQYFEKLIDKEYYVDGVTKGLISHLNTINKDIKNLETEFKNIKHQIDNFLFNTLLS